MNKPKVKEPTQSPFLAYFEELIQDMEECDDRELSGSLRLGEGKIRVPEPEVPVELLLGGEDGFRLQLQPELVLDAKGHFHPTGDYLVLDPTRFFDRISGFVRLSAGASLTLGRKHELQRLLLSYPRSVSNKHLQLKLTENGLTLKNKAPKQGACLAPLTRQADLERMRQWRLGKLQALAKVLQAPIAEPTPEAALNLLNGVLALMENEPYRLKTQTGKPGALLHLPTQSTPILIGDLHARIDNLLVLLTQNAFLEGLQHGSALLIFAGDAVHPDEPGQEAEMQLSIMSFMDQTPGASAC